MFSFVEILSDTWQALSYTNTSASIFFAFFLTASIIYITFLIQKKRYLRTGKVFLYYPHALRALFAPVYEEIIFRGLILFALMQVFAEYSVLVQDAEYILEPIGVLPVIVITSLLFGLWHVKNHVYISWGLIARQVAWTAIVIGPITASLTIFTGSLWPAIIFHALNNLISALRIEGNRSNTSRKV